MHDLQPKFSVQLLVKLLAYGPPEAAETAHFCLLMDCFFDIMNIRNMQSHKFEPPFNFDI